MKRQRLLRGLTQREVAEMLGVRPNTILYWEKNRTIPPPPFVPMIIDFLGYSPFGDILGKPFSEKLGVLGALRGMGQKALARELGVDQSTLRRWRCGRSTPSPAVIRTVDALLTDSLHKYD